MTDPRDGNRRQEPRLSGAATVFVERHAAAPDGSTPAEIIACSGVDFSANGLQLQLDCLLPPGAILRLGADPGEGRPPMYVVGEVRWVRVEPDGYAVGFKLFDSEGTDIIAWKTFVAERLAAG